LTKTHFHLANKHTPRVSRLVVVVVNVYKQHHSVIHC